MTEELRKRLDEAAKKHCNNVTIAMNDFLAGAEFGYKEAIALAKEWIDENIKSTSDYEIEHHMHNIIHEFFKPCLLNRFEDDMLKLLEDKK